MDLIDLIGFAGAVLVLAAFALSNARMVQVTPRTLAVMNLGGGAALALNGLVHHAWPSTVVNTVWVVIATVALGRAAGANQFGRPKLDSSRGSTPAGANQVGQFVAVHRIEAGTGRGQSVVQRAPAQIARRVRLQVVRVHRVQPAQTLCRPLVQRATVGLRRVDPPEVDRRRVEGQRTGNHPLGWQRAALGRSDVTATCAELAGGRPSPPMPSSPVTAPAGYATLVHWPATTRVCQ